MVTWDAVVVGGSVAGSTAARELARRGLQVALVDKARFPRPKACGEGLLPHGVAALRERG
ncbi:MAG TPA: FAD-dependent oxidoreductase, partial [Planctomycetota bacterium]|nr:FAD-dependent oxidoreductase [Planctomycetota bacterium]